MDIGKKEAWSFGRALVALIFTFVKLGELFVGTLLKVCNLYNLLRHC